MAFNFKFEIDGVAALNAQLKAMSTGVPSSVTCEVGFSAPYAIFVHEAVAMKLQGELRGGGWPGHYWDPQGVGRAKFLEQPSKTERFEIELEVYEAYGNGKSWSNSLRAGGNYLLVAAQRLAPLRTGNLRRSGYCRIVDKSRGRR